jgi:putative toxin-antitoxin system antitoxin component (TIGR02293 family)
MSVSTQTSVTKMLGSAPANGPMAVIKAVRDGLPVAAVDHMLDSGALSAAELFTLVLPRKTLANRRKLGKLNPEQSDRLVRVARVIAEAQEVFGSAEKAHAWLRRATNALGGEMPWRLLDTEEGARMVENLLGRISHGIAA